MHFPSTKKNGPRLSIVFDSFPFKTKPLSLSKIFLSLETPRSKTISNNKLLIDDRKFWEKAFTIKTMRTQITQNEGRENENNVEGEEGDSHCWDKNNTRGCLTRITARLSNRIMSLAVS